MPMIEFRYHRDKVSDAQAANIGSMIEAALRESILPLRPSKGEYGVTVEGDPFGPIAHKQPDLRIYIFYHAEWDFTKKELGQLLKSMHFQVNEILNGLKISGIDTKIRFYARHGHTSYYIHLT